MRNDSGTRAALGVAVAMGIALAAALLFGSGPKRAGTGTVPRPAASASGVSFEDSRTLARTRPWIRQWNAASEAWAKALAEDEERFLAHYAAWTRQMDVDSLRIRLSASRIANPRLKGRVRALGDAYRAQFEAVVSVNQAVVSQDGEAIRTGLAEVERAENRRVKAATALIDAFPELAGDPGQLR